MTVQKVTAYDLEKRQRQVLIRRLSFFLLEKDKSVISEVTKRTSIIPGFFCMKHEKVMFNISIC